MCVCVYGSLSAVVGKTHFEVFLLNHIGVVHLRKLFDMKYSLEEEKIMSV